MKEKFLHFVWRFQLFGSLDFRTTDGESVEIINRGTWNKIDSGPDFSMAKVKIGSRIWAGNVEVHVHSSDWDLHKHSEDPAYENVILHLVYEHDRDIDFLTERNVPTLELKEYITDEILENYDELTRQEFNFIPCEKSIYLVQKEKIGFWLERLLIERLERKTSEIELEYLHADKDWEKLLFRKMAYAFGLKVNAEAFEIWADSFDFKILPKIQAYPERIHALFMGQAGFLTFDSSDEYIIELQKEYDFLTSKYDLEPINKSVFKFSRIRPPSFPTVRMMQLASLYAAYANLFMFLMGTSSIDRIKAVFKDLNYPKFWENHFTPDKVSSVKSEKKISDELINRFIINVIIPIKYVYYKERGKDISDELIGWLREIPAEKNSIIREFSKIGQKPRNAFQSQALLELNKHFCNEKKCLNCAIGLQIMRNV